MAKSQVVGFRAHPDNDRDILKALAAYKDRTYGMKELLRLGIAVKAGYTIGVEKSGNNGYPTDFSPRIDTEATITWQPFPEPVAKKETGWSVEKSLLNNFEDE